MPEFITVARPLDYNQAVPVVTPPLSVSNKINYRQGGRQVLVIDNNLDVTSTVVIKGSKAGVVEVEGAGQSIDLSSGYTVQLLPKVIYAIALVNISDYLKGEVTVTGGTEDHHAYIIET